MQWSFHIDADKRAKQWWLLPETCVCSALGGRKRERGKDMGIQGICVLQIGANGEAIKLFFTKIRLGFILKNILQNFAWSFLCFTCKKSVLLFLDCWSSQYKVWKQGLNTAWIQDLEPLLCWETTVFFDYKIHFSPPNVGRKWGCVLQSECSLPGSLGGG